MLTHNAVLKKDGSDGNASCASGNYLSSSRRVSFKKLKDSQELDLKGLRKRTTLRRKAKRTDGEEIETVRTRASNVVEAVGLTGRTRTFVVIEVFEGHQIIEYWKCNDLVQHINSIIDEYHQLPLSEEKGRVLLSLGNRYNEQLMENEKQRRIQFQREFSTRSGSNSTTIIHYHFYGGQSLRQNCASHSNSRITNNDRFVNQSLLPLLSQASRLTYRDLRQIFTDGSPVPSIEIRQHCIILSLPPLSCIIMADRVFILVVEDLEMDGLISSIQSIQTRHMEAGGNTIKRFSDDLFARLNGRSHLSTLNKDLLLTNATGEVHGWNEKGGNYGTSLPLELESLELLISAAFDRLDTEITDLEADYIEYKSIHDKSSPTGVNSEQIQYLKRKARAYQDRITLFDKAFNHIISNESELCLMELSRLKFERELCVVMETLNEKFDGKKKKVDEDDEQIKNSTDDFVDGTYKSNFAFLKDPVEFRRFPHPDVEALLEFFDQEIELFRQRVLELYEEVKSTESVLNFRLALNRTLMLRWDVGSSMLSVVVGVSTSFSGIFGMNMLNGMEESLFGFYFFMTLILLSTLFGGLVVVVLIRRIRLQ